MTRIRLEFLKMSGDLIAKVLQVVDEDITVHTRYPAPASCDAVRITRVWTAGAYIQIGTASTADVAANSGLLFAADMAPEKMQIVQGQQVLCLPV